MPMTTEKIRSALLACEAILAKEANREGVTMAVRDMDADTTARRTSHMLWMARQSLQLLEDGRREKVLRWLGFLQGALWAARLLTIDELKAQNRPDDVEHDKERI